VNSLLSLRTAKGAAAHASTTQSGGVEPAPRKKLLTVANFAPYFVHELLPTSARRS